MGLKNRRQVAMGRGGTAALKTLRRDPAQEDQGVETGTIPRDADSSGREMATLQGEDRSLFRAEIPRQDGLAGEAKTIGIGGALGSRDDLSPEPGEGPLMVEAKQRARAVIEPDGSQSAGDGTGNPGGGFGHRHLQQLAEQPSRQDKADEDTAPMSYIREDLTGVEDPVVRERPPHE